MARQETPNLGWSVLVLGVSLGLASGAPRPALGVPAGKLLRGGGAPRAEEVKKAGAPFRLEKKTAWPRDALVPGRFRKPPSPGKTSLAAGGGAGIGGMPCATCPATPIGCGETRSGALAASDCSRQEGQRIDYYGFDLAEPGPVTIELRSIALDPVLLLLDGNCADLAENDDCRPNEIDLSCLTVDLAAGSYRIGVSSLDPAETGDYELEIICPTADPCISCDVEAVPCGGAASGVLEAGDCLAEDGTFFDVWSLHLDERLHVSIDLASAGLDAFLLLLDSDCGEIAFNDDCAGPDSCLDLDLDPGDYFIVANTALPETGSYDLAVSCGPDPLCGAACRAGTIACGGQAAGELAPSDCPLGDGSFADAYSFRLDEPWRVAITLASSDFDTFLLLLDPAGCSTIETSSDCAGGDSCLTLDLAAGEYIVLANSFEAGATGQYALRVECVASPLCTGCRAGSIPCNGSVSGMLPGTGCKHPDGSFVDIYDLDLAAPGQVDIELEGEFDTFLYLVDSDCNVLTTNDDCTEGDVERSCISIGLEAGLYAVWVVSYAAGETGDYTLEVRSTDCAPCDGCRVGALTCDADVEGTLPASGCSLPGGLAIDRWDLAVAEPGGLEIRVDSDAFDPSIAVHDASCALVAANDDCDGSTLGACLTLALQPGTYSVSVGNVLPGESGPYRLSVACGGGPKPGDCNADGVLDISDGICLLGFLFAGSPGALPCGDESVTDPANISLLDFNASGGVDISDAISTFLFLFVGGLPHPLGEACTPISGCRANGC